jgi:hypothetical protein
LDFRGGPFFLYQAFTFWTRFTKVPLGILKYDANKKSMVHITSLEIMTLARTRGSQQQSQEDDDDDVIYNFVSMLAGALQVLHLQVPWEGPFWQQTLLRRTLSTATISQKDPKVWHQKTLGRTVSERTQLQEGIIDLGFCRIGVTTQ